MKVKSVLFPLLMVTTLVACGAKESYKYVDYDTFVEKGSEADQGERIYKKATIRVQDYRKQTGTETDNVKGTYHFNFDVEGEYWINVEEEGASYAGQLYETFTLDVPNFYTEQQFELELLEIRSMYSNANVEGKLQYALTPEGGFYYRSMIKWSIEDYKQKEEHIYKYDKYGKLVYQKSRQENYGYWLNPETNKKELLEEYIGYHIYSITYKK